MVTFRKKTLTSDLIDDAIDHLKSEGIDFNIISSKDADKVSKVNSKAMVLMSFIKNERGVYQITVKDKEFYAYTRKLLGEYLGLKIIEENKKDRTFTGETNHLGIALDLIEVLGLKYNLSIVKDNGKI